MKITQESVSFSQIGARVAALVENAPSPVAVVFDFDGVIISDLEDVIYRDEDEDKYADAVSFFSQNWPVDVSIFDANYARHILYQDAANEIGEPLACGYGYNAACRAHEAGARVFILTARSCPSAVARAQAFLMNAPFSALETFHVGRVSKHEQLALLLDKLEPAHRIVFVDDSTQGITNVEQGLNSLAKVESEPETKWANGEIFLLRLDLDGARTSSKTARAHANRVLKAAASQTDNSKQTLEQLRLGLDHATNMFTYHAGQRMSSLRHFLLVAAFLAVGFSGLVSVDSPASDTPYAVAFGVGLTMVATALIFWMWDRRNAQLVDCDELLLKEAEAKLALAGFNCAEITKYSDIAEKVLACAEGRSPPKVHALRYGWIVGLFFSGFIVTGVFMIIVASTLHRLFN